jgi:cytochrome P450
MEGTLALAAIAQGWKFGRVSGERETMRVDPSVSLRPQGPVRLRVERR